MMPWMTSSSPIQGSLSRLHLLFFLLSVFNIIWHANLFYLACNKPVVEVVRTGLLCYSTLLHSVDSVPMAMQ